MGSKYPSLTRARMILAFLLYAGHGHPYHLDAKKIIHSKFDKIVFLPVSEPRYAKLRVHLTTPISSKQNDTFENQNDAFGIYRS